MPERLMAIAEIADKPRIAELLNKDPIATLEAMDESALGMEGLVTVFCSDEPQPANLLTIRWGQKSLGLGSKAMLLASRLTELGDLVEALPADRSHFELLLPFWASGAITSAFNANAVSAEAIYVTDKGRPGKSNVVKQCTRIEDLHVIKPMFPKLSKDVPAYVLSLKDQLVAVAAVTHLHEDAARVSVYTVEEARGRGFGRGVLIALAEELSASGVTPTVAVDLSSEGAVRMVERAGFVQHTAFLKAQVSGRRPFAAVPMA